RFRSLSQFLSIRLLKGKHMDSSCTIDINQPIETSSRIENNDAQLLEKAKRLISEFPLIPCHEERPIHKNWHKRRYNFNELRRAWQNASVPTLGIRLGGKPGIIRVEGESSWNKRICETLWWGYELPETPTFKNSDGLYHLFRIPREWEDYKIQHIDYWKKR